MEKECGSQEGLCLKKQKTTKNKTDKKTDVVTLHQYFGQPMNFSANTHIVCVRVCVCMHAHAY